MVTQDLFVSLVDPANFARFNNLYNVMLFFKQTQVLIPLFLQNVRITESTKAIGSVGLSYQTFISTWECCCFSSHWSHDRGFMEIILYQVLSQGVARASRIGKLTVASGADVENCRTIYGLWCSEKGPAE